MSKLDRLLQFPAATRLTRWQLPREKKFRKFVKTYNSSAFSTYTSYELILVTTNPKGKKMSKLSNQAAKMGTLSLPEPLPSCMPTVHRPAETLFNLDESSTQNNGFEPSEACGTGLSLKESDNYQDYDDYDGYGEHRYEIASRRGEEEREKRDHQRTTGRRDGEIEFTTAVVSKHGNFHGLGRFAQSQGAIGAITLANQSEEYELTIGTCGDFAPGWVADPYHGRPMWILHCPDLPIAHIEGCCFFDGLAGNTIEAQNCMAEGGIIGINYIGWQLGKFDKVLVQVDSDLLDSMAEADRGEGSIVIAFVGQESCTLTSSWIPAGMLAWLTDYERLFMVARETINDSAIPSLRDAEKSIEYELMGGARPPKLCRALKWTTEVVMNE